MPEWMHARADHIMEKNPSMPKSEAFAIATQQMHSLGKTPKGYGTAKGKLVAKAKFKTPEDDVKTAGFMVHYGLDGKAARAETHDEWLANVFKRDGAFMVPHSLSKHALAGFSDEFEKIAKNQSFSERNPNLATYAKATGAGIGASLVGSGLGHLALEQAPIERAGDQALMQHLSANAPVPIERPMGPVAGGAHFSPGSAGFFGKMLGGPASPHVKVPADFKNPAFLAHELGHADINANRVGRVIQNPATGIAGGPLGGLAGNIGGFASGFSDNKLVRRVGALAPLAMSAPTLLYEAGASINGLRRLRQGGAGVGQLLQAGKALLPAYGTYLARAGANTAGAIGSQAIGTAIHQHQQRKALSRNKHAMAAFVDELAKIASPIGLLTRASEARGGILPVIKQLPRIAETKGKDVMRSKMKDAVGMLRTMPRVT